MKHIEVRLLVVSVISVSFETGNRRVTKTFIGLASFGVSVVPWELPSYFQKAFFFQFESRKYCNCVPTYIPGQGNP